MTRDSNAIGHLGATMPIDLFTVRNFKTVSGLAFCLAMLPATSHAFTQDDQRRLCTGDVLRLCASEGVAIQLDEIDPDSNLGSSGARPARDHGCCKVDGCSSTSVGSGSRPPFVLNQSDLWAPGPWPASVYLPDWDRRSAWQNWPKSGRWIRGLGDTIRRPS